jgi:hypothetical protein
VSVGGERSGVIGCGNALAFKTPTIIKLASRHIFRRALTPEEVMTLYTNEGIQPPPPAPNPQELLAAKSGGYRYGFQGQERMDEVKGSGNSWDYKYLTMRIVYLLIPLLLSCNLQKAVTDSPPISSPVIIDTLFAREIRAGYRVSDIDFDYNTFVKSSSNNLLESLIRETDIFLVNIFQFNSRVPSLLTIPN